MTGLDRLCLCHSGRKSKRCCGPWLAGRPAPTPLQLMRSRYAAFRGSHIQYLMDTTDPLGEAFAPDVDAWRAELGAHCRATRYTGLDILSAPEAHNDVGYVQFRVHLVAERQRAQFEERSEFRRVAGRWLYHRGEFASSSSSGD